MKIKSFKQLINEQYENTDKRDKEVNKYLSTFKPNTLGISKYSFKDISNIVKKDHEKIRNNDKINPQNKFSTQETDSVINEIERIYKSFIKRKVNSLPFNYRKDAENELMKDMDLTNNGFKKVIDKLNKKYGKSK